MQNKSSSKGNSTSIIKPGTLKQSKRENEVFQEMKRELSQKKEAIIQEFPQKKINSFLEEHLESILFGLIGFFLPIYIRNLKSNDLIAGDEFWSKISLVIILPILVVSFFLSLDFFKEKKVFRLFLSIPAFLSSLGFVIFLFSLQSPQIRYSKIIQEYQECFRSNQSKCSTIQKGIYEDFLIGKEANFLREDESVLAALAEGIRPHSIWSKIALGDIDLQEEFAKRGLVYYLAKQELGQNLDDILADYNGIAVFYSLAFAEANPHLLALDTLPNTFKSQLSINQSPQFPIGILNEERIANFYQNILTDVKSLNREETLLAMYFLTQFSIDLDETSFSILLEHWISFNDEFEKELKYVALIRNQVREQMLAVKKENSSVGINFLEESDFEFYMPFLTSTGISFVRGDDIRFSFRRQTNGDNHSKPVEQIIFQENSSNEDEILLPTILTHSLTEEQKQTYQTSGEETWIYALPKTLVCKTCR